MNQPNTTEPINTRISLEDGAELFGGESGTAALLTVTAQQAVLPRKLDEGIYATLDADGAVQIVETPGYQAKRVDAWEIEHADAPRDIHRSVTVLDADSLIDYLARNTDADDVAGVQYLHGLGSLEMWADIDARTVKATLDGIHGWRKHTATLQLKLSREWAEWAQVDGKLLGQVEIAEFIEGHLSTIANPDGATLLDVCQTLEVTTNASFKQQNVLASGQRVFRFEENLEAKAGQKGDLRIPGDMTLVLRPFQGSAAVPVLARFRFQVREGVLKLGVKLAEPEKALEDAFAQIVSDIQDQVPVRVNHGRP